MIPIEQLPLYFAAVASALFASTFRNYKHLQEKDKKRLRLFSIVIFILSLIAAPESIVTIKNGFNAGYNFGASLVQ